jgi:L-iditol 2-dehydrogenase
MKALVYIGPKSLEVRECPDPVATADRVVLKVVAAGICGSDLDGYASTNGRRKPGQIMGHEAVGIVTHAPEAYADLVGQTMTFTPVIACGVCPQCRAGFDNRCATRQLIGVHLESPGAFAEYVQVPVANLVPWSAPSEVIGTLVEPLAVAWRAVASLGNDVRGPVLVLGAGTIGALTALTLRERLGVAVDVYDPVTWKGDWLKTLNIRSLSELPLTSLEPTTSAADRKYAVVVDCVGSTASLRSAVDQVVTGGRIHVVGMATPTIELPAQQMVSREITISASYAYTSEMFREAAESAADLVPSLSLMHPVVCGLQDAAEHFEALLHKDSRVGKVVICP